MGFSIGEFRSALVGGGARPTLFQVNITNPVNPIADFKTPLLVKAAQIPSSTLGSVPVPFMGRKIKVAGDRTFDDTWTVTVINDEDNLIRNAMEEWSNAINSHRGNSNLTGSTNPAAYQTQAQVIQYSANQEILREYTFTGLWPSEVSTIDLGWDTTDTIEEFTVAFQYDFWEVTGGTTGISTS